MVCSANTNLVTFLRQMKKIATLSLLLLLMLQCKKEEKPTAKNTQSLLTPSAPQAVSNEPSIALSKFKAKLDSLPKDGSSSRAGLEIFRNSFSKESREDNDKAFKMYLVFQATLINTLNAELENHPDFEKIGSLIWADSTLHEPEGKAYEKYLMQNGLRLASTEGTLFIERETGIIMNTFYEHLTPATQEFFIQFEEETNVPFSEDGGLTISLNDLADRLAFWDSFLARNPVHLFSEFAKNNVDTYLHYFLAGMDNTPAYDYESKKIDKEFLSAYQYFVQKYDDTNSAKIVNNYLELLTKNDFVSNEEIESFIRSHAL